ncbi:MAG: sporulation transcription factor Spo0A [Firmicutes bacterium]|nr:sporulation transcription factor Spo0A [Bacillota bacterium]
MDLLRLGIADDNLEFCMLLRDYFSEQPGFKIEIIAYNGQELIRALRQTKIDVLLLDMIMPEIDGLGVLKWLKEHPMIKKPKVIIFSAFAKEEVAQKAVELGVDYYILKPFDLTTLKQRILEIASNPSLSGIIVMKHQYRDLEKKVADIIEKLGIPPRFKGYSYLEAAIISTVQEPSLINEVTTKLYPTIAKLFDTNEQRVERAMRFAIETAWNKGDVQVIHDLFGYCVDDQKGKPTNASFIAIIADKIRLDVNQAV